MIATTIDDGYRFLSFINKIIIDRGLDEYNLRNFLFKFNETYPDYIASYTFISKKLNEM